MQEEDLRNLQAELQRERARLADEIGSRFDSLTAKPTTKGNRASSKPAEPFVPRPATLGLGADAPKKQENARDVRLKGLLSGKRKREAEQGAKPAARGDSDDDERETKRAPQKQKVNDPFKQSKKANKKQAKAAKIAAAAAAATASDEEVTVAATSSASGTARGIAATHLSPPPPIIAKVTENGKANHSMQAVRSKLAGARFRQINEELYTSPSTDALAMMRAEPAKMHEYHEGFREQTKGWPKVPVRQIFDMLQQGQRKAEAGQSNVNGKQNGKAKEPKSDGKWGNGRLAKGALIVDLGAGEGMLAQWLSKDASIRPRVLSFDLLDSDDGWVVGVDVAKANGLPLPGKAIVPAASQDNASDDAARIADVAVFCLSLMATNWIDKIREASRILRPNGELIVAEVTSRFIDVARFKQAVVALGFRLQSEDNSNTHFVLLTFVKLPCSQWRLPFSTQAELHAFVGQGPSILKPCIYKRR